MSIFAELKRRNVFRVGIAYAVAAWLILQLTEVLTGLLELGPEAGKIVIVLLLVGFIPALIFAWAFELTPEGLKREHEVDRSQSITQRTGRKLDLVIIAVLAVALTYFVADKFWLQSRSAGEDGTAEAAAKQAEGSAPTIAVLPLADMSQQGDSAYFSDGLTEELLNILAKISELQVAGRTSSFAFKGQNEDLREIGRKLNVKHILEGSVRKDDSRNRVRITLQLISTEDGFHLWSETYDRDLDDIFAIQEEVAHEVARALRVTLLGEDESRIGQLATTEISTYELYLQGRAELAKAGFVNLERAQDLFQRVLSEDPAYTPARLGLVETWLSQAATGAIAVRESLERSLPILESILVSEPDNATALRLMATSQINAHNIAAAEGYFQRALELEPRNAITLVRYGRFLYNHGKVERGVALMEAAVEIEPYDQNVLFDSCQTSGQLGEFERAVAACRRIQAIDPTGPQGYYGEGGAYIYQGKLPQAMLNFSRAIERDPEDFEMQAGMSLFWGAVGDEEQARIWLDRAEAIGAGQPWPVNARLQLYERHEQYDRAGELATATVARKLEDRHGTAFMFRRAAAAHAMRSGHWETGLAPYRELLPWAFEPELVFPENAPEYTDDLILVAALLKYAEPLSERPSRLLEFAALHAEDFHPGWGKMTLPYRLATIAALRGEHQAALDHLRAYLAYGLLPAWRAMLIESPALAPLKDDPDYRALLADAEALAEQQRIEARALLGVDS